MMRLYEIPIEYEQLQTLLEESAGELTPEIEAAWKALEGEATAKVEAAQKVLLNLEAASEAAGVEAERLSSRSKAFDASAKRLKALMLPAIQALGGKVKTPLATSYVQTRKNVLIELKPGHEAWELPEAFYRIREPELNKTEIKKALEAGETVPECLHVAPTENTFLVTR